MQICLVTFALAVLCLSGVQLLEDVGNRTLTADDVQTTTLSYVESFGNVTDMIPVDLSKAAGSSPMFSNSSLEDDGLNNWIVIKLPSQSDREQSKQVGPPANPGAEIANRLPCSCKNGNCACCTGMLLQALRSKGCMNLKYMPDDFAFVFEMKMNNMVLYKNKISGRNPAPICVNPPRIPFIEVCATFYDVYFFGRNMHVCMEFGGFFQGYELFSRSFDCLRVGAQGVRIVKPEDDVRPQKPASTSTNTATDAEIDSGDGIEDYDENIVRRFDANPTSYLFKH